MFSEYRTLAEDIINKATGKKVVYIPNPGNWGDGLIRYGTKLFFEDYRISHVEINIGYRLGKISLTPFVWPPSCRNIFFIYGGGGAWCNAYSGGLDTVKFLSRFTKNFLVLPSTYEVPVKISCGSFYRRGHNQSSLACPSAKFCPDMAFYVMARSEGRCMQSAPKDRLGVFLRNDLESDLPDSFKSSLSITRDLSAEGDHMSCGDSFLREVAKYGTIFTDRLHIAIAGAATGSKVHLLPGNYFKIREVHEASLKGHFNDITLYPTRDDFLVSLSDQLDHLS